MQNYILWCSLQTSINIHADWLKWDIFHFKFLYMFLWQQMQCNICNSCRIKSFKTSVAFGYAFLQENVHYKMYDLIYGMAFLQ